MTGIDWTRELVDQLGWHWEHHLRPRLSTLTDDEYLWEPVPGAWSLRRRADATTCQAAGAGDTVADLWRMAHLSIGIFGSRAANHFGNSGVDYQTTDWPLTPVGGLDLLDRHDAAWMAIHHGAEILVLRALYRHVRMWPAGAGERA